MTRRGLGRDRHIVIQYDLNLLSYFLRLNLEDFQILSIFAPKKDEYETIHGQYDSVDFYDVMGKM